MRLLSLLFTVVVSVVAFAQVPTITSFSPTSGPVGTTVTITGTGFDATTAANNIVYFGGAKAIASAATATTLTVSVPAGFSSGYMSVSKNGLTSICNKSFRTTNTNLIANYYSTSVSTPVTFNGTEPEWQALHNLNSEVLVDFNGDGKLDFAKLSSNTGNGNCFLSIYTNVHSSTSTDISSSSFSMTQTHNLNAQFESARSLQYGDLDGDGDLDLALIAGGTLRIYANNSSVGGSISFSFACGFNSGVYPNNICIADYNVDGKLDIHCGNKIYFNAFNGTWSAGSFTSTNITPPSGTIIRTMSNDVNSDGKPDVVYTKSDGKINVALNTFSTTPFLAANLAAGSDITIDATATSLTGLLLLDKDNNGSLDIVIYGSNTKKIYVLSNDGNGSYTLNGTTYGVTNTDVSANYLQNLYSGDINGDGLIDVFAPLWVINGATRINVWTGSSGLTFNSAVEHTINGVNFHTSGAIGDINGDNKPDIVATSPYFSNYAMTNKIGVPTITSFTPTSGGAGANIIISGTYFSNASSVKIGGSNVSFTVNSDSQITAVAGTNSGQILITTPLGSVTSSGSFTLLPVTASPNSLSGFSTCAGTISSEQTTTVSGNGLGSTPITVTAPNGYEISLTSGSGFTNTLSLAPTGGAVSPTTIYVRLNATATAGNYNGNLTATSGSNTATVALSGVKNLNSAGTASSNPTLCINTALTDITRTTTGATGIGSPSGLPTGVTATWSANTLTVSGTPTASGTFTYTIPLTGGCGSVNATGTITVTPNIAAGTASSTPTLCVSTLMTNITHTTTGVTSIGTTSGLPTGVSASYASNLITISGTPSQSGSFTYTIPLNGTCGSASNATGTITVNANNTVQTLSANPTLCVNTALTNITRTTTGATGISTATGLPAGVTASWASNVITISGTPTAAGIFNYTIPLTGGCGSVTSQGTITVNGSGSAGTASTTPTVCNGNAMTAITHTTTGVNSIGVPTGLPGGVNVAYSGTTITLSGSPSKTYGIGSFYNGGRIAYIFQPNDNGYAPGKVIIVDPNFKTGPTCTDKWTMANQTAVTSTTLGEGLNNTNNLVAAGHTSTGTAIGWVDSYTDGVYSDWFVPSKDELFLVLTNLTTSFTGNGIPVRSSSEIQSNLGQTHAYMRSGSSVVSHDQNDGGCASMIIARYDVLPTNTPGNVTYNYSIPLSTCPSGNATGTITVADTYTWTGQTNSSAATASNWNPAAVPCSGTNIIIPSVQSNNYPSYTNLTIDAGTTLTVQTGGRLTVTGTLTNNGTMTIESGATLVQGASSTLAGSGTYNVKQNITGAGSTTPSGRFWYLGSPVSLSSSSVYFGNAANVVKKRDEATNAWITVASGTPENLVVGKGYYTQAMANSTINFTGGVVNNGAITINGLTRTSGQGFEGFNLVSNPYPSYLNWDDVTKTNVDGTMWYRTNDGSNMVFDTYVAGSGGIGTNLGGTSVTKFIPPMQSFWVRVSQGQTSGSLTLGNAMRSHFSSLGGSVAGLKSTNDEPSLFLRMNLLQAGKKDQLIVYVNETATNGFDALDGEKMMQAGYPQFYTKAGDKKIVINGLNSAKKQQALPITLELPTTGVHSFIIEDLEISNGLVWLEDKQEEIIQALEPGTVYEFFANSGMNSERFVLHFQLIDDAVPTNVYNEVNSSANFSGKGANVHAEAAGVVVIKLPASTEGVTDIQIKDAAGKVVYTGSTNTLETSVQLAQANGIYYVTLNSNAGVEVRKVFIQQ